MKKTTAIMNAEELDRGHSFIPLQILSPQSSLKSKIQVVKKFLTNMIQCMDRPPCTKTKVLSYLHFSNNRIAEKELETKNQLKISKRRTSLMLYKSQCEIFSSSKINISGLES